MLSTKKQNPDPEITATPLSRRQKTVLVIITLALHAGAILTLFCMKTDTQKFQQFFQELVKQAALAQANLTPEQRAQAALANPGKTPEEQEEWGAMKARASRFGAPVIFQEEPEFMIQEPPEKTATLTPPEQTAPLAQNQFPQNTQTENSPQAESAPEQEKNSQKEAQNAHQETTAQKAPISQQALQDMALLSASSTQFVSVSPEEKMPELKAQQESDTEQKTPYHQTVTLNSQETEAAVQQEKSDTTHAANKTDANDYFPGWGKKDAAPITKKMVSMASLARGFLDNIKNEGPHAVTMIGGKEGGKITTEQLKMERYVQRLNWYLQNSFRINRERYRKQHPSTTAEVYLVLERNGHIKDVRILRTSGDPLLDDHTLFVFKDAGSSFPPVPQYLPQDPFTITYVVEYSVFDSPPQKAGFNIFS
ncbi:energy transducer TonB [Methylicorpusculum sp.]|uniref:energy transducer TonB n=1 Tax=Methylicorpusculum sp. TaxID=2713644 RepID=UPI002AB890C2|nr:energy transducer TonB [Methylicorpusculum sp.]MDZ4149939.1 energy transducer TonB [Methylicorpusculum sp.]